MSDTTREVLMEIGDRARGIVEELARQARQRAEDAAPAAPPNEPTQATTEQTGKGKAPGQASAQASPLPADLLGRLGELRACVGQVADVLEGAVERLETVEGQLGDPDAGVEEQLRLGLARCEHLLLGIEHRVLRVSANGEADQAESAEASVGTDAPTVLVVADCSRRRASLCLALERQGLRTLAAFDLRSARNLADRFRPGVALIASGDPEVQAEEAEAPAQLLQQWTEALDRGLLPRPLVLVSKRAGAVAGYDTMDEEHGEAALAASLTRMARGQHQGVALAH